MWSRRRPETMNMAVRGVQQTVSLLMALRLAGDGHQQQTDSLLYIFGGEQRRAVSYRLSLSGSFASPATTPKPPGRKQ